MKQPVFLELTDGCYGLQRDGIIIGPLTQDANTGRILNKIGTSWYPTGLFSSTRVTAFDIIEIIPEPEKLPEPFEAWVNVYGNDYRVMHSTKEAASGRRLGSHHEYPTTYRCTVTPIERVK